MSLDLFLVLALLSSAFPGSLCQSAQSVIEQKAIAKELEESEATEGDSFGSPPAAPYAEYINTLGVDLLRHARATDGEDINMVFSPLSISATFSLLHLGAIGSTKFELEDVFGFEVHNEFPLNIFEEHKFVHNTAKQAPWLVGW